MVKEHDRTIMIIAGTEYWTAARAAKYLNVCKHTLLDTYCKTGLAHLKMCNNVLFQEKWLKDFVDEKTQMQTHKPKGSK